jgi:uncharacterized protein with PIN domain
MRSASFRFYAELNDFLPPQMKHVPFQYRFSGHPAIKDAIEALGVPHTEVDLILVNGCSVGFKHQMMDGDEVSVYPVFETFDISPLIRLRPEPLRRPRFILDAHLGRLARYLRLIGFDSLYRNDFPDAEIAAISSSDDRIILTRDRGLLKRGEVRRGYCVREIAPGEQLVEVVRRFDLLNLIQPFSRCMECNGAIRAVQKSALDQDVSPYTRETFNEFGRCDRCGQVYWKGSHYTRLQTFVDNLVKRAQGPMSDSSSSDPSTGRP